LWLIFLNLLFPENLFIHFGAEPRSEFLLWYYTGMKLFYKSKKDIDDILLISRSIRCPVCGQVGFMNRHGYRTGYINNKRVIRCWRLYCDPRGGGCGHTPSLRLCGVLRGKSFSAKILGLFIEALVMGYSVKSAWDYCGAVGDLITGSRTFHWLNCNQCNIRSAIYEMIDVKDMNRSTPSFITLLQLFCKTFKGCNIAAFQLKTQKDFAFP